MGSALMDAMDEELERLGVEDVEIGVDTGNEVATRLYEAAATGRTSASSTARPGASRGRACAARQRTRRAGRGRFGARPGPLLEGA